MWFLSWSFGRLGIFCLLLSSFLTAATAAPFGNQLFEVTSNQASDDDLFGISVAASGNLGIVGAPNDSSPGASERGGAAYIFDLITGSRLRTLFAMEARNGDFLGSSVAIRGDIAAVGADGAGTDGAAYLFKVSTGEQLFRLTPSNPIPIGLFGTAVATDGNRALVGSWGSAHLFDVATGAPVVDLLPSGPGDHEFFGSKVGLDGPFAVVGETTYDGIGTNSGAAFVFNAATGEELRKLIPSDAQAFDAFGSSIAVSANLVVVGASGKGDFGAQSGAAYVFDLNTGNELHRLQVPDLVAGDRFGFTTAINDDYILVGTGRHILNHDTSPLNSIFVFDRNSGQLLQELLPSSASIGDDFGSASALGDTRALIGASHGGLAGIRTGTAFIFAVPEPSSALLAFIGGSAIFSVIRHRAG